VLIIFISSSNSDEQIVYLDLDNVISNTKIDVLVDKNLINDAFKFYNNLS